MRHENANDKTNGWDMQEKGMAIVDGGTSEVTARGGGNATIIATAEGDSSVDGQCVITVVPAAVLVTNIAVDPAELELVEGETETLAATVLPADATDNTVTWSSDDPQVAAFDADGLVTAVAAGTALITATANDGSGITGTCEVPVEAAHIPVTGVTLLPLIHI